MVARGLGRSLLKGRKKKVSTDKLMNRGGKERGGQLVKKEEKGGALAVRPSMGLVPAAQDLAPVSKTTGDSDVVIIKKQVIQVRDILKDTQSAKQKERVNKRKALQEEKRKTREEKIEKPKAKPKESKSGMKMPTIPGLGIGNWLQWVAFGVILNKLVALMPLLKKIFNIIRPIAKFLITAFEKFVEFVVGGIDLAYKGIDALKTGLKAIGGEGAVELFNKFGKLFTTVVNGALIAALVAARSGAFSKKPGGGKGGKPGKTKLTKTQRSVNKRFGKSGKRLYDQYRKQGMSQSEALKRVKRAARKNPSAFKSTQPKWQKSLEKKWKTSKPAKFLQQQKKRVSGLKSAFRKSPVGRLSKNISKTAGKLRPKNVGNWIKKGGPDKALKSTFKKTSSLISKKAPVVQKFLSKNASRLGKLAPKLTGKAGKLGGVLGKHASKLGKGMKGMMGNMKGMAKVFKKVAKGIKIPVVGPLIVAGISIISGEGIGRAAFKGIGAALGGILGNLIPIPVVGMLIGEGIGMFIGDFLYEGFLGKGWGAAASQLGETLKGMVTGAGKIGKAMVDWIFGGGLLSLLKAVGGGIAKFAKYLFGGGLLMQIIKGAANVGKLFVDFIFGGGLFKLIGGIAGLPLKFAKWMLMTALPWTFKKIGGAMVALKDWLGRGVTNLIANFPTVPIPDINPGQILSDILGKLPIYKQIIDAKIPGIPKLLLRPLPIPKAWKEVLNKGFSLKGMLEGLPGVQEFLGFFAQHIPVLKNWVEGGKLTKIPNLLFLTPLGMPLLMPTIAKSFFPGKPGGGTKGTAESAMAAAAGGGGGSSSGGDMGEEYVDWLGGGGQDKDMAAGLDTRPSYGTGGMTVIENTTTYIQPIEV